MKYVEAMIRPVSSFGELESDVEDSRSTFALAMRDLCSYADLHESDGDDSSVIKKLIALVGNASEALDAFADAIQEHDCAESALPFVPVGSTEDIDTLLRREGFLSADVVAIVKLSDLEALAAYFYE